MLFLFISLHLSVYNTVASLYLQNKFALSISVACLWVETFWKLFCKHNIIFNLISLLKLYFIVKQTELCYTSSFNLLLINHFPLVLEIMVIYQFIFTNPSFLRLTVVVVGYEILLMIEKFKGNCCSTEIIKNIFVMLSYHGPTSNAGFTCLFCYTAFCSLYFPNYTTSKSAGQNWFPFPLSTPLGLIVQISARKVIFLIFLLRIKSVLLW